MIARRRWQADAFATYLVRHPLVTHLVRRLVFGAYDASGALIGTFRVAEDATYAGAQDELFVLPEGARVGVVHPLEIDVSAVAAWGQRLSEYEILQPFAQLGRDTPRDVTLADLERFAPVGSLKLLALERRGWRRGRPGDGGIIWELEKDAGSLHVSNQPRARHLRRRPDDESDADPAGPGIRAGSRRRARSDLPRRGRS